MLYFRRFKNLRLTCFAFSLWLSVLAISSTPSFLYAAPGDILFSDDFERAALGADWTVTPLAGGDAGIGTHTASSGTNSIYTRWDEVTVTSNTFDLSARPAASLSFWLRIGDDAFSEDPEATGAEDLLVEYLNNSGTWLTLIRYQAGVSPGQIFTPNFRLPADALHAGFQFRFHQAGGDGEDWDYYHIDDVILTEAAPISPIVGGGCDDFESGLANWQVLYTGIGDAGIGTQTFNSAENSLFLRWGPVTVESTPLDFSSETGVIVNFWLQRGDDAFSEDPDTGEDFVVEYLNDVGTWILLETFDGGGTPGEIFSRSYTLGADALHAGHKVRFRLLAGSNADWDYWHLDDICVSPIPPPATLDLRMDEYTWSGTANDVLDNSGNGHHGIAMGDADTIDTGKLCRAGEFDGNSDYVRDGDAAGYLEGLSAITVAVWVKSNRTDYDGGIFSTVNKGGQDADLGLRYDRDGWGGGGSDVIKASIRTTEGSTQVETVSNQQTTDWQHLVFVWESGSSIRVYVNGSETGLSYSEVALGGTISGVDFLEVGHGTKGDDWDGLIDEVLIFDSSLSAAQIQTGYDNQAAGLNWDGSARECPAAGTDECLDIPTDYGVHGATKLKVGTDVTINGNSVTEGEAGNTMYPDGVRTDNSPSLPLLTPESFPENDSETEIEVDGGESATINPGSYKEIKLKEGASATFSPSGGEFHIGKLNAKDDSTLTFAPGTYYIDEFNAKEETTINVSPDGEVKIYIGDKFTTDQKSTINTGGSITDFQVYLYPGSKLKLEEETQFTGFVYAPYADNEIELKKEVDFNGSFLSSGEVEIKENVTLHFSEGDQQDLANNIACGDVGQQLDHIRLEHDGAGLTCMAETVTIRACADADCTEAYTDEVTVDLTSPASGWSSDPVTFSGGSTTVKLRHTTAETVTIAAVATSPTADNPTLCVNSGGGAACELVFAEVGVLIDGDDSDAAPESNIVTQIAGKPSNVAPPNPALQQRVRVVRTDDETGACIAGVGNETLNATFQYLVPIAAEGLDDNTITVTGNTSADLASAGSAAAVELAFDGNGTAPFNFTATDAGRYRLRVDLEIPVTDAAGAPTGETIPATDTGNAFVVRPLALFADAAGNLSAQSADGDAYQQAGAAFSQTFTSLRWTAGRDGDNDGLWDDCGSSTLADPGTPLARVPAWNIGQPVAALVLPAAGNDPGLSYGDGNVTLAAADSVTADNVAYPEVGIIQFQGSVGGGFLGEPVGICSPYIGRFYPDHFLVTIIPSPPTFTDACIAGNYSYLGEPFPFATPPIITISAMNGALSPAITRNYDCGGFWKFAPSMDLAYSYTDSSGNGLDLIPAANTVNPLVADTTDCSGFVQLTLTDTLTYARPAITSPIDPFAASVDLAVDQNQFTDSDLVCYDTGSGCQGFSQGAITGTILRHGIIQVFNNFGPETMDITHSPFAAHYYDGTSWVTNTEDECSTALAFCSSPVAGRVTPLSIQPDPLNGGLGTFTVTTAGTFGETIDICLTAPVWLSETDCTAPGLTCGAFTFGIYRGNDRIINWQEIIQ